VARFRYNQPVCCHPKIHCPFLKRSNLRHLSQHGHVVRLAFDDVGEKDIGLSRLKQVRRYLFHGKDDRTGGEILLRDSTRLSELFLWKDPDRRRLHPDFYPVFLLEFPGILRRHRNAAFPAAFVLSANSNARVNVKQSWLLGLRSASHSAFERQELSCGRVSQKETPTRYVNGSCGLLMNDGRADNLERMLAS
jgi:hypothetical protein